jgi:hypothetical protein
MNEVGIVIERQSDDEGRNDGPKRTPFWRVIHALECNVGCSDSLDLLRMFTAHSQLADNILRQIEERCVLPSSFLQRA